MSEGVETTLKVGGAEMGPEAGDLEAWLDWRSGHIGASESAAALGISQYQQPLDVYNLKTGIIGEQEQTFPMWFGKQVESILAKAYVEKTKKPIVYPVPGYRSTDHPHLGATPDAYHADRPEVLVDMKATGSRTQLGQEGTDEIPAEWISQAQQQMLVMDAERVEFCVVQSNQLGIYTVDRNPDFINMLIERLGELWDMIQNRTPPEPEWTHTSTGKAIAALVRADNEFVVPLGGYELELADKLESLRNDTRDLEKERDEVKHKLMWTLKDYARGRLPDGRVLKLSQVNVAESHRPGYDYKKLTVPKRKKKNVSH